MICQCKKIKIFSENCIDKSKNEVYNDITMQIGGDEMVYTSKAIKKETERQDVRCLYEELLKNATAEQKEKAIIAATAFLLGSQQKSA